MGAPFPDHGDAAFAEKLLRRAEMAMYQVPPMPKFRDASAFEKYALQACQGFETGMYQFIAYQYLSRRTPYRSVLLYHGLGTGKTCSAITLAEAFLADHRAGQEAPVWVVASAALQDNFIGEIYGAAAATCTGDLYDRLMPRPPTAKAMRSFIKKRYRFLSYEAFYTAVETDPAAMRGKVVIIDEVQNLRNLDQLKPELATHLLRALLDGAAASAQTRLVLLSATPMYNNAEEIMRLFALLLANDGRANAPFDVFKPPALFRKDGKRNVATFKLVEQLAQEYVSVVRGSNPLTFAPRLSPAASGVDLLDPEAYPWVAHIRDGIVPSPLGDVQAAHMASGAPGTSGAAAHAVFGNSVDMQACNIVYPGRTAGAAGAIGEDGFFQVFMRKTAADGKSLRVAYANEAEPWLTPTPDRLGRVAAKMLAIVESIGRARGIVMVYSEYVWSGVLPLAIALEHAGYTRYMDGNFLATAARGRARSSYVILSGSDVVAGSRSIADLLRVVNDPANVDGHTVKVVLLTPVASEGLTLKNVREVHVLDPWYHMNYREQVIGRALRQCSHNAIASMRNRNVTVFQHATVPTAGAEGAAKLPADLRAYEIAAGKQQQMELVAKVLRDHAFDCALQRNANYAPRALFPFAVTLRTSQGADVPYQYGDDPALTPRCHAKLGEHAAARVYDADHLVPTAMTRLRKFLASDPRASFTFDDVIKAIGIAPALALETVREALTMPEVLPGHRLMLHQNRLYLAENRAPSERPPRVLVEAKPEAKNEEAHAERKDAQPDKAEKQTNKPAKPDKPASYAGVVAILPDDDVVAKWTLYGSFTKQMFVDFATDVLRTATKDLSPAARRAMRLFESEGVWIGPAGRPTGFIDIYVPRTTLDVYLWNDARQAIYKASRGEQEAIAAQRVFRDIPDKVAAMERTVGFFDVRKADTTPADVLQLQFQLLFPDALSGKQRGAACMTKKMAELQKLLEALGSSGPAHTLRKNVCLDVAQRLAARDQLFYPPFFKRA